MAVIWAELKRRNVVKVAVAYAIVGWLLIEVSATLLPAFEAPDWVLRVIVLLAGIGFILALVLSWAYELTPDGLKPSHEVEQSASITRNTRQKLNYAIVGVLVLAVGFLLIKDFLPQDPDQEDVIQQITTPVVEPATESPAPVMPEQRDVLPNSVAVLPFENLSLDPEDAFFAAGIHDELLNQLVKILDLNVIARTSVLNYAKTDLSIPEIAAELNVETVMEGTVRYAEDSVRVTTQLIDAATGAHLWSETYTSPFENIFEIETDIAMRIAAALEAEFSLEEQQRIDNTSTSRSPEAFAIYIRARERRYSGGFGPEMLSGILADLQRAIALDPEFAQPHALLATIYAEQSFIDLGTADNWRSRGDELDRLVVEHAERALELDPNLGNAYTALGKNHLYRWRGQKGLAAHEKAMSVSPNDAVVIMEAAWFYYFATRHEEAVRLAERAVELDPNNSDHLVRLAIILNMAKDHERSRAVIGEAVKRYPINAYSHAYLAQAEARQGNYAKALESLQTTELLLGYTHSGFLLGQLGYVYGLAKSPEDAARILERMETVAKESRVGDLSFASAYMGIGDHDRALALLTRVAEEKVLDEGASFFGRFVNNDWDDPVLEQPEFVEVRQRLRFPDL